MSKKQPSTNRLIKRKSLIYKLKKSGIDRSNPEALSLLEKNLEDHLDFLLLQLKEHLLTHGKKTLKKEDIKSLQDKKEEEGFEI
jgi:histone H3/H4